MRNFIISKDATLLIPVFPGGLTSMIFSPGDKFTAHKPETLFIPLTVSLKAIIAQVSIGTLFESVVKLPDRRFVFQPLDFSSTASPVGLDDNRAFLFLKIVGFINTFEDVGRNHARLLKVQSRKPAFQCPRFRLRLIDHQRDAAPVEMLLMKIKLGVEVISS